MVRIRITVRWPRARSRRAARDDVEAALPRGEPDLPLQATPEHHPADPAAGQALECVGAVVQHLGGERGVAQLARAAVPGEERDQVPGAIEILEVEVVRRPEQTRSTVSFAKVRSMRSTTASALTSDAAKTCAASCDLLSATVPLVVE